MLLTVQQIESILVQHTTNSIVYYNDIFQTVSDHPKIHN